MRPDGGESLDREAGPFCELKRRGRCGRSYIRFDVGKPWALQVMTSVRCVIQEVGSSVRGRHRHQPGTPSSEPSCLWASVPARPASPLGCSSAPAFPVRSSSLTAPQTFIFLAIPGRLGETHSSWKGRADIQSLRIASSGKGGAGAMQGSGVKSAWAIQLGWPD